MSAPLLRPAGPAVRPPRTSVALPALRRRLGRAGAPRIVAIGGGTGLPVLLRGLREALFSGTAAPPAARDRLTALVTVADDGGSSGRLRRDLGVLPPGDIRNCLVALAENPRMATIFDYRFEGRDGLAGHSLGNLILAALSRIEDRFGAAVESAGEILGIQGRVLPATVADVRLVAELAGGARVDGESAISAAAGPIRRVRLVPGDVPALPEALRAIAQADVVVIGPGSLYTSVIPVLLVREIAAAIVASGARVVMVMNLMTEPGETRGLTAADHVRAVLRHAPGLPIHDVLLSDTPIEPARTGDYAADGAEPVAADGAALRALGCAPRRCALLAAGERIRHDGRRLAEAILAGVVRGRVRGGQAADLEVLHAETID